MDLDDLTFTFTFDANKLLVPTNPYYTPDGDILVKILMSV